MKSALHSTDCASSLMTTYLTLCPILLMSLSCKSVMLTMGTSFGICVEEITAMIENLTLSS